MFGNTYEGKKILVTGHTGFKGSWLALWLSKLKAEVTGYSLAPPTDPNHHDILGLDIETVTADVRDLNGLCEVVESRRPDIVFHLAAQAIVRRSYNVPIETFETNVIGTSNVCEACRRSGSVGALVVITSDKCYENTGRLSGYKETDPLGGHDPYSASKACAELVTTSYLKSFFPANRFGDTHHTLAATARAGNVVGGGDWGEDRLVPDVIRAARRNERVIIRNPGATRPWQHVLEPLAGYLLLGQKLLEGHRQFSGAWNFGPEEDGHLEVISVIEALQNNWPAIDFSIESDPDRPHEAEHLALDCSKSRRELHWGPAWYASVALEKTAQWYREFYETGAVLSQDHLAEYEEEAKRKRISWATG